MAASSLITTLFLIISAISIPKPATSIGVNYGRLGNNLPTPSQVARFLSEFTTIDAVKLFDADPSVLRAFSGTGLPINIAIPNDLIPSLTNLSSALRWVRTAILPHALNTNITRILVGNEVLSTSDKSLIAALLPAMQNLHIAVSASALGRRIKISTPHSLGVLSSSSPPSTGQFRHGYDTAVMKPLLSFLRATNSAFMVNAYPFFGFSPETLDYALFRPNFGVLDVNTGLTYTNMLDGQLDAIFSAMKLLGFEDIDIVIAETGWPSAGESSQLGVSFESARDYNGQLARHVASGSGTPLMPNRTFETYIFSLFNEDLKPGPASERNFGLFHPDMTPVYDIGILRYKAREPAGQVVAPATPTALEGKRWCVARETAGVESLQQDIDFVCGQGLDCGPIKPGGACFSPDTVEAHAAYAMNEYYQATGRNSFDCDFRQTGVITTIDPSYGRCKYTS